MRTPRQLQLLLPNSHGGKRRGAGRPNRSGLKAHLARPKLLRRHPVHVTIKLRSGLPSLRKKTIFKMFRGSVRKARMRGFRVAHFAILSNHVHLLMEPRESGLGPVFQSLCGSFSRNLNRVLKRKGSVFLGRYDLHVLRTPTEVRRALGYVLSNDSRHRSLGRTEIRMDPFSSALALGDLKNLFGSYTLIRIPEWPENALHAWYSEILSPARSWLLTQGWLRADPALPGRAHA